MKYPWEHGHARPLRFFSSYTIFQNMTLMFCEFVFQMLEDYPCLNATQWVTDAFWLIIMYLIAMILCFSSAVLYHETIESIPAKELLSAILVLVYFVYFYQCRKFCLAYLNRGIEHLLFEPAEVDISKPTCKICYLNFNQIRRPLILTACGHSVCEECIENLNPGGHRRFLSCPFCRTLTVLEDWWELLPKNYAIIELYEGRLNELFSARKKL